MSDQFSSTSYFWQRWVSNAVIGTCLWQSRKDFKGSQVLIPSPSPSVKIQIMGGKVCLRCKGKTLLGDVNKLFVFVITRLEEKLFFSFLRARSEKKLTFILEKSFLCKQILFLSCKHFVCVQCQNKFCFFTIKTSFFIRGAFWFWCLASTFWQSLT